VPLTPGQNYYIEATGGVNPFPFAKADNIYPAGDAFIGSQRLSGIDLHMQVVEWAANVPPPSISRFPAALSNSMPRRGNLADDFLTVSNSGKGVLNYHISVDVPWASAGVVNAAAGTEADIVTVHYSPWSLFSGLHTGTITISAGRPDVPPQTVALSILVTPPPFAFCDFDTDGDVDMEDFGRFQSCLTSPGDEQTDPVCAGALLDDDQDVDQHDADRFIQCLSGSGLIVDTTCSDPS
jgi:hypothetical protein